MTLYFDKYPLKMRLCFISLTFISLYYQRLNDFCRVFYRVHTRQGNVREI